MIPVVTPEEMGRIDAAAGVDTEVLIERAARAVTRVARQMLAQPLSKRAGVQPTSGHSASQPVVLVVAGGGNNGADGRTAAHLLAEAGIGCDVVAPANLAAADVRRKLADDTYRLVIDAAFGTGLNRPWNPPPQPAAPVLAVDVPSGVDGLTGRDLGSWDAEVTVTFGALKVAHVLYPGAAKCGEVHLDRIGLHVDDAASALLTDASAHAHLAGIDPNAHKWQRAVRVVAGSAEYSGAGWLASAAALGAGAGAVVASCPGTDARDVARPVEAIARSLPADDWATQVLDGVERFGALVVGPGLGRDEATMSEVRTLVARCPVPVVVDADGLAAVASHAEVVAERAERHGPAAPTVLTPHVGEWTELMRRKPDDGPIAAAREAAAKFNATVLLKGPTTVVAPPDADGVAHITTAGNQRLATAGSGDVLSGVIASCIAALAPQQLFDPNFVGAVVASAAHWHGRTATLTQPPNAAAVAGGPQAGEQTELLAARGREPVLVPLVATEQVAALPAARQLLANQ